ncbi:MAG: nucleotidyltransferase domain-containing protein [Thermoplasmatota archaeon]
MGSIQDVKAASARIAPDVLGVIVWGSTITGHVHPGSDVDVCVVAGPGKDPGEVLRQVWLRTPFGQDPYDVKIFEDLPLFLKGEVMEHGSIVVAQDEKVLWGYLWHYQKLWADQRVRRLTHADIARLLAARDRAAAAT